MNQIIVRNISNGFTPSGTREKTFSRSTFANIELKDEKLLLIQVESIGNALFGSKNNNDLLKLEIEMSHLVVLLPISGLRRLFLGMQVKTASAQ